MHPQGSSKRPNTAMGGRVLIACNDAVRERTSHPHRLPSRDRAATLRAMHQSPWPLRVDGLLFREAVEADIVVLQSFRNDPGVNRFMVRTYVEPDDLCRE